jgi:hypothetical protein
MDGVKAVVEQRGANIEYARMYVQDHERWRRVVHSKHMWAASIPFTLELVVWMPSSPMRGSHLGITESNLLSGSLPGTGWDPYRRPVMGIRNLIWLI